MPNSAGVNELPDVGQIEGIMLMPSRLPAESKVQLQYTDQQKEWHQITMPFLDAMYLLNLLKAMQTDSGFQIQEAQFGHAPQKES